MNKIFKFSETKAPKGIRRSFEINAEEPMPMEDDGAMRIQTNISFWRRLWNLIKNPFTYLFYGRIEY
jgi:hypothetical protein